MSSFFSNINFNSVSQIASYLTNPLVVIFIFVLLLIIILA